MGEDTVISFYSDSKVKKETLAEFALGRRVDVWTRAETGADRELIASRAERFYDRQKYGGYNVVLNNCETFTTFCVTGKAKLSSKQVTDKIDKHAPGAREYAAQVGRGLGFQ